MGFLLRQPRGDSHTRRVRACRRADRRRRPRRATDRALLKAVPHRRIVAPLAARDTPSTHNLVVASLVLITISGFLLFASDFDTFLYSKFFWIKMGLVALLVINGLVLVGCGTPRALGRPPRVAYVARQRDREHHALVSDHSWRRGAAQHRMMRCTDCPSRRGFLQIVAGLGLAALPVLFVDGIEAAGEQKFPFPAADGVTIDRKQQSSSCGRRATSMRSTCRARMRTPR